MPASPVLVTSCLYPEVGDSSRPNQLLFNLALRPATSGSTAFALVPIIPLIEEVVSAVVGRGSGTGSFLLVCVGELGFGGFGIGGGCWSLDVFGLSGSRLLVVFTRGCFCWRLIQYKNQNAMVNAVSPPMTDLILKSCVSGPGPGTGSRVRRGPSRPCPWCPS